MLRFPPTTADRVITELDRALRAIHGLGPTTGRPSPGRDRAHGPLDERARRHSAGLMRVDHAGEVAAQALYHGQALTARSPRLRRAMQRAAVEENDHLGWCRERLEELGARPSRLDPLWYLGSLAMGVGAGLAGDRVSLGFLAETEHQVVAHLDDHLERLPPDDSRSRAILEQMRADEGEHATAAEANGALPLPGVIRALMRRVAQVMTRTAYYL
jgi:ubiquinone biosynthesis monooxygenase Coq7